MGKKKNVKKRRERRQFRAACQAATGNSTKLVRGAGKCHRGPWKPDEKRSPPDWSAMDLEEIKKNFYEEHPLVTARDEAAVKEYRDANKISVEGRDCPKPIEAFSECSFSELVMSALLAQNISTPTPVQSQALPIALSGRDMIAVAETGSGKTLAYVLPAITHIHGKDQTGGIGEPDVVVLSPTHELAQQIHEVVLSLDDDDITCGCFYGGTKRLGQIDCAMKEFKICIATPGRLNDFIFQKLIKLHRCTYFVLDEADRMLDMGFAPQIKMIIEQARPDRQMLMFSATWPSSIRRLAETYLKDYIMVNIGALEMISANHNITQRIEICEQSDKPERVAKIMAEIMELRDNKTVVFVNSKFDVDVLTFQFRVNGWEALGLHGSMSQPERDCVYGEFKSGKFPILIATDLAARGLDVDDIQFIVNYDFPNTPEDYVHRIGRTGRCNRKGTAITLFTKNDRYAAKDLILLLEEALQPVPPELKVIAELPPVRKRRARPPGTRAKKKELKRLIERHDVNKVPLGFTTNTKMLPNLEDIDIIETPAPGTTCSGNPKTKIQFKVNTGNDNCTKRNADFQSNSSVQPVIQKDEENPNSADESGEGPCKKMKTSVEDTTNSGGPVVHGGSIQVNRQDSSLGMNNSFPGQQRMRQNLGMSMNPGNMGMNMNHGNMRMPMNPGNMGMPMNPGNMRMPVNHGNMGMPMNRGNMRMPMNRGNMGMPMNRGNMGMPRATGWGNSARGNYMGQQNSGWGGNYRPGMVQFPAQYSWTASGYNQSSGRYGS